MNGQARGWLWALGYARDAGDRWLPATAGTPGCAWPVWTRRLESRR